MPTQSDIRGAEDDNYDYEIPSVQLAKSIDRDTLLEYVEDDSVTTVTRPEPPTVLYIILSCLGVGAVFATSYLMAFVDKNLDPDKKIIRYGVPPFLLAIGASTVAFIVQSFVY